MPISSITSQKSAFVDRIQVQVQIVTFHSEHVIDRCLQSVLSQTYPHMSIIVVDNASKDTTITKIQMYPRVRLYALSENVGYAAAHNLAFTEAVQDHIDYVLTVNPDVQLEKDYVERCVSAAVNPTVGGVTGKLVRMSFQAIQTTILDSTGLLMGPLYHAMDRGAGEVDAGQYDALTQVWGVCGAAALYRVAMLLDLEPEAKALEKSFFLYKEDVDLCWHANQRGWTFAYEPSAIAFHERGWKTRNSAPSWLAKEHSLANQVAILLRHGRVSSPIFWVSLAAELVRLCILAIRRPLSAYRTAHLIRKQFRYHVTRRRHWHKKSYPCKE